MWRAWKGSWFVGAPGGRLETRGVFERLCEITPLSAVLHATARAQVDAGGRHGILDRATNAWHLSHQVDEVLIGEFPDLLLLWIGHNNIDWRFRVKDLTDESCDSLSAEFVEDYARQMRRLLKGAVRSRKLVVIIVYGLINFKSFFDARREAERRREDNPAVYPYLEKDYDYFVSMRPEHRDGMVRLAECYNKSLKDMCEKLGKEIQESDVRLVYSDALSRAEITGADMLSESDAWHPSPAGHSLLAEAAYHTIKEQLKYLGWEPEAASQPNKSFEPTAS
jgi:lysophospholipase L1-like esterase